MARSFIHASFDDRQMQEWFLYAGYKVRDAREPFRRIAFEVILRGVVEQLETEGGRGIAPWVPLSMNYAFYKAKDGYGDKPILERTGAMREDLLNPSAFKIQRQSLSYEPGEENQLREYGKSYAHWHQTGGTNPTRPPRREIVVWTELDDIETERIFTNWLDDLRFENRRRPSDFGAVFNFPGFSVL